MTITEEDVGQGVCNWRTQTNAGPEQYICKPCVDKCEKCRCKAKLQKTHVRMLQLFSVRAIIIRPAKTNTPSSTISKTKKCARTTYSAKIDPDKTFEIKVYPLLAKDDGLTTASQ